MRPERDSAIRSIVLGADTGYRERAATIIGGLGSVAFALAAPTDAQEVCTIVQRERAEVAVLDATGCEGAVADVIESLAQLAPLVGVVVVCEHLTPAARELRALPKWGWTRELRAAVQRARIDGSPLLRPRALPQAGRPDPQGPAPIGSGSQRGDQPGWGTSRM